MRSALLGFLLLTVSACSGTRGSAVATDPSAAPYVGKVRVVALWEPTGMKQVGIVEASTQKKLPELIAEFSRQTAKVGGSLGKVDSMRTKFELVTRSRVESYSCGTTAAPRTCTRHVTETVEIATTTAVGRAFR